MRIAIGSTRGPKVDAAREVITLLTLRGYLEGIGQPEFIERAAESGVTSMPLSLEEVMAGARNRADNLRHALTMENVTADFYVGMEGGFVMAGRGEARSWFLQNWAYVSDGKRGSFGAGGALFLPKSIVHEVADRGRELAEVIDEFSNRSDVRSREGAWGILTRDLISRKDAFKIALLNAFAPFYNPRAYSIEAF